MTNGLFSLIFFCLVASAIISWLVAFNIVNTRSPAVYRIMDLLDRVTVYDVGQDDQLAVVNTAAADPGARPGARGPLGSLTLVVNDVSDAQALAQARWNGELDVDAVALPASLRLRCVELLEHEHRVQSPRIVDVADARRTSAARWPAVAHAHVPH